MRLNRPLLIAVLVLLVLPGASGAATLAPDTTAVISGTPDLLNVLATPVGVSDMSGHAVSADGRFVAFDSNSDGLVVGDDDSVDNVFVKDTTTGVVTLVSRATGSAGEPSHVSCDDAVISDDGLHVAFACNGALNPGEPTPKGVEQVYERDLSTPTPTTTLISRATGLGAPADKDSDDPAIDANGSQVAFDTASDNLGTAGPNAVQEVFRRTVGNGNATVLVSRTDGATGTIAASDADDPAISGDGTIVAFVTAAALDATADTNGNSDVYVRNLAAAAPTTQLVSRAAGAAGAVGNGRSQDPAISASGAVVAFDSTADDFDPVHDPSPGEDVYVRALGAPSTTTLISGSLGATGSDQSGHPTIDAAGDSVEYVVGSGTDETDETVSVVVRHGATVTLASRGDGNGPAAVLAGEGAISADGTKVAFRGFGATPDVDSEFEAIALRDLTHSTTTTVSRPPGTDPFLSDGGEARGTSVSADGRFVAFLIQGGSLLRAVTDPAAALTSFGSIAVVRDTVTGAVTVAGRADGVNGALIGSSVPPHISADGRRVAFVTSDDAGNSELLVRDLATGRTFVADRADGPDGAIANGGDDATDTDDDGHDSVSISDDGSRVAFRSSATNLSPDATDGTAHVYVRDIDAGRTFLVDRPDGSFDGAPGNRAADAPAISGDGGRVAFASRASNLGDGDSTTVEQVHVRTIDDGVTQLASTTSTITPLAASAGEPSIDRDGGEVSFLTPDIGPSHQVAAGTQLELRDLAAPGLTVAGPPLGTVTQPGVLSADGSSVAFGATAPSPTAPGDVADGVARVFERTIATGVTRLVSRASGADGAPSPIAPPTFFPAFGITADGGCVTFAVPSSLFPQGSPDVDAVFMRVFEPDCGRPPLSPPGSGSGSGGSGSPAKPDRTAPRLSKVRLSPTRFTRSGHGAVLSLTVSEASKLSIAVDRRRPGRRGRVKGKATCTVVARAPKKGACVAYSHDGTLRATAKKAGAVRIAVRGRVGARLLAVGAHRLTIVARDASGNASKAVTLRFTIVKSRRAS